MKKFMPFVIVFAILAVVIIIFLSLADKKQMIVTFENPNKKPIEIVKNKYQDAFCGMVIEDTKYASQVIRKDGKSWFFHDHGDFVEWLKDKPFASDVVVYVHTIDTHQWIDAQKAFYSIDEITPMGYGFGAYKNQMKNMINYESMRLRVLRGETMNNPQYRKKILKEFHGNS